VRDGDDNFQSSSLNVIKLNEEERWNDLSSGIGEAIGRMAMLEQTQEELINNKYLI
jgi:hypothetical protein